MCNWKLLGHGDFCCKCSWSLGVLKSEAALQLKNQRETGTAQHSRHMQLVSGSSRNARGPHTPLACLEASPQPTAVLLSHASRPSLSLYLQLEGLTGSLAWHEDELSQQSSILIIFLLQALQKDRGGEDRTVGCAAGTGSQSPTGTGSKGGRGPSTVPLPFPSASQATNSPQERETFFAVLSWTKRNAVEMEQL